MRRVADVAVVGAGIAGLAHAYVAARAGRRVVVFERSPRARGASVRNFGMVWPIGQPAGRPLEIALRSRSIWLEALDAARLPSARNGSLHVVYRDDEAAVAREFAERGPALGYDCHWLSPAEVEAISAAQPEGLLGGLFSATELTVDPRVVAAALPALLEERYGATFRFAAAVRALAPPRVETASETWEAGEIYVCPGDDFETLYPELLQNSGATRVKLQMMRTAPQPDGWKLGPALAGGLSLRFYPSFRVCESLGALRERIARETPEFDRWGVHVMASQNPAGELVLGDSHEYGLAVEPWDKPEIDELILGYLRRLLTPPDPAIAARWHGVYSKHPERPWIAVEPEPGVRLLTALGGAGMTLSFGLAEANLEGRL